MKHAILVFTLLASCGGKMPQTRFYELVPAAAEAPAPEPAGVTLAIEPLETETAYDDERIVYRENPYRFDYYNYHRWSAPPGALIANHLERTLEQSGRFRQVTRNADAAAVTLGGRVIALEEVDRSKNEWVGRVVVELRLTDSESGDVLWTEQYEEIQPMPQQSPEGLAKALSAALDRIAAQALPEIADVAVIAARERERDDSGRPPRAARRQVTARCQT